MITYTDEKRFTQEDVEELFRSIHWVSGQYPAKLRAALMNSSAVLSAWDGSRLVGLLRALDDGCMTAFLHYMLVHPDYQGRGVASGLMRRMLERYEDYFYVDVMPEESRNAPFYEKFGFERMQDGVALTRVNRSFRDL